MKIKKKPFAFKDYLSYINLLSKTNFYLYLFAFSNFKRAY